MRTPRHLAAVVVLSILSILISGRGLAGEMAPLKPAHARLLEGRQLLVAEDGVVHVRIAPAPVVRLTDELLSLTFAFPSSNEEALEIAQFPHTGAVVPSEKVLTGMSRLLRDAGFAQKAARDQDPDIDSFAFPKDYKGMAFGETVTKRKDGGFTVGFVALVRRPEDRMQCLRVRRFACNFDKDGLIQCHSQYDLLVGPALEWQTHEGSPPPAVSHAKRRELTEKMLAMCGKALPPKP